MGVAISDWRLARAVALQGHMGVVSGTGIDNVLVRRLQDGDAGGHVRRALAAFPNAKMAQNAIYEYFLPEGRAPGKGYKRIPLPTLGRVEPAWSLSVLGGWVETWLAKEGHGGHVGLNLLTKLQMHTMAPLLGAMLAGVDAVIMGAGIPRDIPAVMDAFAEGKEGSIKLDVKNEPTDRSTRLRLDPAAYELDVPMPRPAFFPIITSHVLAQTLARKASGSVEGFVIESSLAGGHNAPPRGPMQLDELGQPIYTERDETNLEPIRQLGLPFWLAGGNGTPEGLKAAEEAGAAGIQVGSLFAFCTDSGMRSDLRRDAIAQIKAGAKVFTDPLASPTGFPFKVLQMKASLADPELYAERTRICDIGYLREAAWDEKSEKVAFRCAAEPVDAYVRKGGELEATIGRKCLCNALMSDAGLPQIQRGGEEERGLVTTGDDAARLANWPTDYSAADVLNYLEGHGEPREVASS